MEEITKRACHAMNTLFEVALWGREPAYLRTVAEETLEEVRRLEQQLSFFRADSHVRDLNLHAAEGPVPVDPRLFRLLERARQLNEETEGGFDITIAPLLKAWRFVGGSGAMADEAEVEAAREVTGMHLVELDPEACTVRFLRPGVMIDLGAIGKGYAIEEAAEIVRDALDGHGGALIHGGTSTVQAVGGQPDGSAWPVAIRNPLDAEAGERANPESEPSTFNRGAQPRHRSEGLGQPSTFNPQPSTNSGLTTHDSRLTTHYHLTVVELRDQALSVSAVHGKSFTEGDERYGHVLDPRSGRPTRAGLLAAVVCDSATDSDALSTGLLTIGEPLLDRLAARPHTAALLAVEEEGVALLRHRNMKTAPPGKGGAIG